MNNNCFSFWLYITCLFPRKYLSKVLLTILLSITSLQVYAYDFIADDIAYNIVSISDLTCEVAEYQYLGDIVVPDIVRYNGKDLKVIGIGSFAFNCNSSSSSASRITSVTLPDGIEYFGREAFRAAKIEEIRIPKSLKRIEYDSFDCSTLKRIYIDDLKKWCECELYASQFQYHKNGAQNALMTEGELYLNNKLCETLVLPRNIKSINKYAFSGVASIKEVVFSEGLDSIGAYAFYKCLNITSIKLPSTCQSIGAHVFDGCERLYKLELPEGLKSIGDRAFANCSFSSLTLPSSVNHIGRYLFEGLYLSLLTIRESPEPLLLTEGSLAYVLSVDFQRDFQVSYYADQYTYRSPFYYENENKNTECVLSKIIIGPNVKKIPRRVFPPTINTVIIQESNEPLIMEYVRVGSETDKFHRVDIYYCGSPFINCPISYLEVDRCLEIDDQEAYSGAEYPEAKFVFRDIFGVKNSFKGIVIGNRLTDISFLHFNNYSDLSYLVIGNGVDSIPDLSKNEKLENIVVNNNNPPKAVGFSNKTYVNGKLYVPKGCVERYQSADIWKNFFNINDLSLVNQKLKGDVNQDGRVDVSDIVAVINFIACGTTVNQEINSNLNDIAAVIYNIAYRNDCNETADVNEDETVDISDIVAIINIMASGITDSAVMAGLCPDSNHPHVIDLGDVGKWACCNVGASSPLGHGGYYAWGETEEKEYYDWKSYIHCDGTSESCHSIGETTEHFLLKSIAGTDYDVAHVKWGGKWRMPTLVQMKNILNSSVWTTINGINGRKYTAPNGNSIFLPAEGYRSNGVTISVGLYGKYWLPTIGTYNYNSRSIEFYSSNTEFDTYSQRYIGRSVRPIFDEQPKLCPDTNHPHVIDMGDAGKWACCNVGASAPWEYGGYYSYFDADIKKWGENWCMPSLEQIKQLSGYPNVMTTINGIDGKIFTDSSTGNSIFLPAAGRGLYGNNWYDIGGRGFYWSSTSTNQEDDERYYLDFDYNDTGWGYDYYGYLFSIRLVTK